MKQEMITISRAKYDKMKKQSEIDMALVKKIKRSLEDIKHERIRE